jgi:hypothetical protein
MEPHDQRDFGERTTTNRGWQFSLLSLLVVTTVVSICLAIGVSFPRIAVAAVAIGLVEAGILYLGDWLIRSRGGRTVMQVVSIMWALLGSAMLVSAFVTFAAANVPQQSNRPLFLTLAALIGAVGLLCWIVARRRWPE